MNSSILISILIRGSLTVFCFAFAVGPVCAQPNAKAPQSARTGYLSPAEMPDVARIVPSAPTPGDRRDSLDLAIFRATRSFEGSPRWSLAISDDDESTAGLFKAFACSLGVALTRENAPRLTALVTRATIDGTIAFSRIKQRNQQRKRPFLVAEGPICVPRSAVLEKNPDYPSGHTAFAWEVGLILAEIAPDAATAILSRARAFGESRVVCGVHNASAVEAGVMTATAVVAALHGSAVFRADLDAARSELAGLRRSVSGSAGCALEAEILAKPPY